MGGGEGAEWEGGELGGDRHPLAFPLPSAKEGKEWILVEGRGGEGRAGAGSEGVIWGAREAEVEEKGQGGEERRRAK